MVRCVPILVIICCFISHAVTVFDPFDYNQQENFDPAQADPKGNITCLGEEYGLTLPVWNGFNPNGISMQKLCAKTQYRGGPPGQNVGAYCHYVNSTEFDPRVMFDPSSEAEANPHYANPRVLLGCAYRCFCNFGLNGSSLQPKKNPGIHHYRMASSATYFLQIDINDEMEPPFYQKPGPFGSHKVQSLGLDSRPERRPGFAEPWLWTEISLDPLNQIECFGDLPTFDIPFPFTRQDFRNVQQLCAIQLSFGNGDANAGGYCHRSVKPAGPRNTVWFSDEMTPRHDWTWTGGNLRFVASLRWHCSRVCACSDYPHHDNITTKFWQILETLSIVDQDKSLYLISKATGSRTEILPRRDGPNSPSGSCGPSGKSFCPLNWDYKAWGPIPYAPVGASEIIKPQEPSTNISVCGNECHQPADCGSTSDQYNCSCAIPTMTDIRTLGLDPVAPVAICIALFASSMKHTALNGRSVPGYTDYLRVPHTCKCNATHIADECCVPNTRKHASVRAPKLLLNTDPRTSKPENKIRRSIISQNRLN